MVVGIAIYHRLVVEGFRSQFVEDKRELESLVARQKKQAESPAVVDTGPPVPLAMNTQPATGPRGDSVPTGVPQPGPPAAATSVRAPAAPAPPGVARAVVPSASQVLDTKDQLTKAGLLNRPAADPGPTPPQPQPKPPVAAEPHPIDDASPPPPLPAASAL